MRRGGFLCSEWSCERRRQTSLRFLGFSLGSDLPHFCIRTILISYLRHFLKVDLVRMDIAIGPFLSKQTQIAETQIKAITGTVESRWRRDDQCLFLFSSGLVKVGACPIEFSAC
jgi:hypothetical protein